MIVQFSCQHCRSAYHAQDGLRFRCRCGNWLTVPYLESHPLIAIVALGSVLWLSFAGFAARGPRWNGSPATLEAYTAYAQAAAKLDQTLAPMGITSSGVFVVIFLLSVVSSF